MVVSKISDEYAGLGHGLSFPAEPPKVPDLQGGICTGLTMLKLDREDLKKPTRQGLICRVGFGDGASDREETERSPRKAMLGYGRTLKPSKIDQFLRYFVPGAGCAHGSEGNFVGPTAFQMRTNHKSIPMPLIYVVGVLIVVGVLLWLVNTYIPMDGKIKSILNAVVVIAVVIYLLQIFGLLGTLESIKVGHIAGT
jgi:hypothetical protein